MQAKSITPRLIRAAGFDPWFNLAAEHYLLDRVRPGQAILFLWQNDHTVVIGRNQNPWKECRCRELEASGGKLARRLSGGGAVYHDLGNLNFSFITPADIHDIDRQVRVILKAVRKLGIPAQFSGRNDLTAEGRKFSGNAFYESGLSALHHGTLLIDCNLDNLTRYLQVSEDKIQSKGIDSIRSRVVNLKQLNPRIEIRDVIQCLEQTFTDSYGPCHSRESLDSFADPDLKALYDIYSSWQWNYGESPKFDITYETRFPWGGIELGMSFDSGRIGNAVIYSDAMNSRLIREIADAMKGAAFKYDDIQNRLTALPARPTDRPVIDDLLDWLRTRLA